MGERYVEDVYVSLEEGHSEVTGGVARGHYNFWLGSGISRRRAKTVPQFLRGLLIFLRDRLEAETDGPHRLALIDVLALADVSDVDGRELQDIEEWSDLDAICLRLANQYSAALDVDVDGQDPDYLLWDGIDVVAQYTGPIEPDIEHVAVALLGAEGAVPTLVSANWDPLVERAYELVFTSRSGLLKVEVHPDEFRPPHARTELIKFHGCATLALENEGRYRPLMIARKSQISDWITDDKFRALRERVTGIVRDTKTLIAGLSAQDADIQAVFGAAANMNAWSWPDQPGAVVIATPELGHDQKQVLKQAYDGTYSGHAHEIQRNAQLGAYPSLVFLALLVHVWVEKLAHSVGYVTLTEGTEGEITAALSRWGQRIAAALSVDDVDELLPLVSVISRGFARFKDGKEYTGTFVPLSTQAIPDSEFVEVLHPSEYGLSKMSVAIGVLLSGEEQGKWNLVDPPLDVTTLDIHLPSGVIRQLRSFAHDGAYAAAAMQGDSPGPLTLIVESSVRQRRSPVHQVGRTGRFDAQPFYLEEALGAQSAMADVLAELEGYLLL
ncbi:hypothetical protein QE375_003561 [Microbacterium foliorum]|uniref:SIR2-like domain-containing protein n=1 Tax=Microbacterium foliorum TaxID=104336 RepID=A0ABU1HVB6_9MICO|nr:SIR2 family protein [Microbacterium foliorum]MDR6144007.1 hypothetical protein [Microbacterium foliorum]